MTQVQVIRAEVEFWLNGPDPNLTLAELRIKARELDEENGNEPPESYTLAQAFQVCWHYAPEWLYDGKRLAGWTLNRVDTGDGMEGVWP